MNFSVDLSILSSSSIANLDFGRDRFLGRRGGMKLPSVTAMHNAQLSLHRYCKFHDNVIVNVYSVCFGDW